MASKLKQNDPLKTLERGKEARQQQTSNAETAKSKSKKSLRLVMETEDGTPLDAYLTEAVQRAGIERGTTVTKTQYLHELILKDMAEHKTKGSFKITKKEKISYLLEKLDDKKLAAIATLLNVQL